MPGLLAALRRRRTDEHPKQPSPSHQHDWDVASNDDDVCACGAWRYWPSGEVVEPADMSPGLAARAKAEAAAVAARRSARAARPINSG